MARFGRVITAMVTPFREDGSMDIDEAGKLARHLVDHGSEGLVVAGSTGEASTLTDPEQVTLFRAVKDAVGSDASVIAGTGTNWTEHSIELTREAEKAGADAALVVTPYYNRPPQDALLNHFRTVADSSNLPILLYDIPSRTATKIEVETILRAAEHPNIVGLKDAGNDISTSTLLAAQLPEGFEIYSGDDGLTLAFQAIGGVGVISVMSHVMGDLLKEQFDAFESGNIDRARAIQFMQRRANAVLLASNPISIKAALNMIGFKVGAPRPPLRAASADEETRIREALATLGAL
ncbi:MAG: 4-hydroxy-tetrahydrodipicolinate synthase [Actinomycetota bacterium]